MSELHKLIGKKIVAVRGIRNKYADMRNYPKLASITAEYILFDDEETYIDLREQDYHDYHDCSESARYLDIRKDKDTWKRIFSDIENFPEATEDP